MDEEIGLCYSERRYLCLGDYDSYDRYIWEVTKRQHRVYDSVDDIHEDRLKERIEHDNKVKEDNKTFEGAKKKFELENKTINILNAKQFPKYFENRKLEELLEEKHKKIMDDDKDLSLRNTDPLPKPYKTPNPTPNESEFKVVLARAKAYRNLQDTQCQPNFATVNEYLNDNQNLSNKNFNIMFIDNLAAKAEILRRYYRERY